MRYYSTNNKAIRVSLEEAVLHGLAPDGGLYMPEMIKPLPESFFAGSAEKSFSTIALDVARQVMEKDLPEDELRKIVDHTLQFDAPLVAIEKDTYALELFHGPTLAFKDFGARFLSGLLGYFARRQKQNIVILVATSGDTGSAVANGFLNVEGTRVVVLYPSGKVSPLQEKQFTTLGGTITALEIDGTFDDCQRLVKTAFLDAGLSQKIKLASANSINIARLIPQMFYYFNAWAQLKNRNRSIVFSVPSGNFGNLTAGLIARRLGLPVERFIAATNANDSVPAYLTTGSFNPRRSIATISNAMDVGNPSNFSRIMDLYDNNRDAMAREVVGYSFNDDQTRTAMKELMEKNYLADPHGAVGYLGLKSYQQDHPDASIGVFLETAHPGKFNDVVEATHGTPVELPARLAKFLGAEKKSIAMENDFGKLKQFMLRNFQ